MKATGFMTNSILTNLIAFLTPVVAIALVIFCVVQAVKIFSGSESGSFRKLITGTLTLLFIIGIMYIAGSFSTYGTLFQNLTNTALTQGAADAGTIITK